MLGLIRRCASGLTHFSRMHLINGKDIMSNISISELPLSGSKYVNPYRINYTDHQSRKRTCDAVQVLDAVSVVLFSLRPVVFATMVKDASGKRNMFELDQHDFGALNPQSAVTYELCSGVVDKDKPLSQIVLEEIEEECGYAVPDSLVIEVTTLRGSVGVHGSLLTLFYAEVTDEMKISDGGGLAAEHEHIEVIELPVSEARTLFYDQSKAKAPSLMAGLMWFLHEREAFLRENGFASLDN